MPYLIKLFYDLLINHIYQLYFFFRYNLRRATYALIKVYGKDIRQYEMSWSFWKEVTSSCHVHDKEMNYISLEEYESRKRKSE